MDTTTLTVIAILAVAAFVQSVSGFGFALVAMAALPVVIDVRDAIGQVTVFNIFVSVTTLMFNRTGLSFRRVWPLLIGVVVGIPAGYYFLRGLEAGILVRILGGVLIGLALVEITFVRRQHLVLPRWMAFPCGLIGGVIGGAFNTGGPPIVAYVYSKDWSKTEIVAALQATFIVGGLLRNGLMFAAGDYTRQLWLVALWAMPAGLLAIWAGKWALGKIRLKWLRVAVFVFLLAMGVKYLWSP